MRIDSHLRLMFIDSVIQKLVAVFGRNTGSAPDSMENFFGALKTACLYLLHCTTKSDVEQPVAEYVHFHNLERIHLKDGPTPFEIRSKAA